MQSAALAIAQAIMYAKAPLSLDEICQKVYGRTGDRERNTVRQNIFRLDEQGKIEKFPAKFGWKKPDAQRVDRQDG
jgi:hypothetical protein